MKNVADLLSTVLPPRALKLIRLVGSAAQDAGAEPYLVGGSVRDVFLIHQPVVDLDIALVGADSETFDRIASRTGGLVSGRSQFNTATLLIDGCRVDLAMARSEQYPTPGSLPEVSPGTLGEDLARRDFSVNAMAVSLSGATWGELFDPHAGLNDLRNGLLRVLHRYSFRDDPTRILRAARYLSRLALRTTPETRAAILESVEFIDQVSAARIRNELERVFGERTAAPEALRLLTEWRALAAIDTALKFVPSRWTGFAAASTDLSDRAALRVGYAILGYGLSDADVNRIIAKLRPHNRNQRAMRESAGLGWMSDDVSGQSNSNLAEVLDPLSESSVRGAALAAVESVSRRLFEYLESHRHSRTLLTGDDLIGMGVERGPAIGLILKHLRDSRLDGQVDSVDDERAFVRRFVESPGRGPD